MLTKKLVLGLTTTAALLLGAPAFADGGRGHRHGHGNGHAHGHAKQYKHHWKHHHRPVVVHPAPRIYHQGYYSYAPPPPPVVVYRPAPHVVYAPAPVYHEPDVRVNIGLRF